MTRKWVATHASAVQSSANYEERYEELVRRYEQLSGEIQGLDEQKTQRLERADTITLYLQKIIESEELKEFDPRIWLEVIERATVFHDGSIVFTFQDGKKLVG